MTHPFHPLFGREFVLLERAVPWGRDRAYYLDESGNVRVLPTAWTDLEEPDPWVVIAAGRSAFRLDDLLELADLLERRRA